MKKIFYKLNGIYLSNDGKRTTNETTGHVDEQTRMGFCKLLYNLKKNDLNKIERARTLEKFENRKNGLLTEIASIDAQIERLKDKKRERLNEGQKLVYEFAKAMAPYKMDEQVYISSSEVGFAKKLHHVCWCDYNDHDGRRIVINFMPLKPNGEEYKNAYPLRVAFNLSGEQITQDYIIERK